MKQLTLKNVLVKSLKDPAEALAYLKVAFWDDDPDTVFTALKTVIDARGGMGKISRKTGLSRSKLNRMFNKGSDPLFRDILTVVGALGFSLVLVSRKKDSSFRVSKKTLAALDSSMANLKKGKVSKPIDLSAFSARPAKKRHYKS
jgi:probable addiction module antidote protein